MKGNGLQEVVKQFLVECGLSFDVATFFLDNFIQVTESFTVVIVSKVIELNLADVLEGLHAAGYKMHKVLQGSTTPILIFKRRMVNVLEYSSKQTEESVVFA